MLTCLNDFVKQSLLQGRTFIHFSFNRIGFLEILFSFGFFIVLDFTEAITPRNKEPDQICIELILVIHISMADIEIQHPHSRNEGLMKRNEQGEFDNNSSIEFEDLCLGNYEIVKLPWEPKYGEIYYFLDINEKEIMSYPWENDTFDYAMKALGMIYRTEEGAQAHFAEDYERLTGKPLSSR